MDKIRILIADDHTLFREGLRALLTAAPDMDVIGEASTGDEAIALSLAHQPDVVLMDIQMPGISGIDAVKTLQQEFSDLKILMLTTFDDDDKVFYSLCFGASGYLLKGTPPSKILEAIKEVHEGGSPMSPVIASKVLQMFRKQPPSMQVADRDYQISPREKEVLECLVKGMSLKMIGDNLNIAYDTVRSHIKHIYEKLHVVSMTEAVAKVLQEGLV